MKKRILSLLLAAAMVLAMTACGSSEPEEMPEVEVDESIMVELNGEEMKLADLVAKAQEEGEVQSVGMPDDWANWKDSWAGINTTYGLSHADVDMTSAEEIAIFDAEKDDPTKDVGDIGLGNTLNAKEVGVLGTYKASTWDSFPEWAKDPNGEWIMTYTGSISFIANTDATGGKCPTSWAEVREGDYAVTVGNVLAGAASQCGVISAAIAFGGGLDNVQPGIDFFKELAKAGRLDVGDSTAARMASGESVICVANYEYSTLLWRDNITAENPNMKMEVVIPSDGSITTGYCQILNKYSARPHAGALAIEYLCSDAGAIDRAVGYARPTKSDVVIPEDVAAKLLPDSMYTNCTNIMDIAALQAAQAEVARLWETEVLPLVQ